MWQVGDLGRSSVGGKGVRIDVRRGLRFQSPEAICSGITSKVTPPTFDPYNSSKQQQTHQLQPAQAICSTGDSNTVEQRLHDYRTLLQHALTPSGRFLPVLITPYTTYVVGNECRRHPPSKSKIKGILESCLQGSSKQNSICMERAPTTLVESATASATLRYLIQCCCITQNHFC